MPSNSCDTVGLPVWAWVHCSLCECRRHQSSSRLPPFIRRAAWRHRCYPWGRQESFFASRPKTRSWPLEIRSKSKFSPPSDPAEDLIKDVFLTCSITHLSGESQHFCPQINIQGSPSFLLVLLFDSVDLRFPDVPHSQRDLDNISLWFNLVFLEETWLLSCLLWRLASLLERPKTSICCHSRASSAPVTTFFL